MSKSTKKTETEQVAKTVQVVQTKQTKPAQVAQVAQGAQGAQVTTKPVQVTTKPVQVKKSTETKEKKETVQPVQAGQPVVQAVQAVQAGQAVEPVQVDQEGGAESNDNSLNAQYLELQNQVSSAQDLLTALKNNLKRFHKVAERQIAKLSKNKRNQNQNRTPTGFGKARGVPSAIITLLGLENGAQMTRPDVTKKLYEYIDANNLRSDEDKRIIRVNDGLSTAFKLTKDQVKSINASKSEKDENGLNFYNIQKYVAKLYQETDLAAANEKKVVVEGDMVEVKVKKTNK